MPLVIMLTLMAAACSDASGPGGPSGAATLLPLAVGTQWSYAEVDSVEYGPPHPPSTMRYSIRVTGDTTIAGERFAVLDSMQLLLDDNYRGRHYLSNRADGVWNTSTELLSLAFPGYMVAMLFPYPAHVGDHAPSPSGWRVVATDVLVRVPAGEFHCIRYDFGSYATYFVAPGVGIVAKLDSEVSDFNASGTLVSKWRMGYQLTSYQVGP